MQKIKKILPNTWLVQLVQHYDSRGTFVKTLTKTLLDELGCNFTLQEEYYSASKKNVIRGMHFQLPPYDHVKIVSCVKGKVLDVLLDLRRGPNYGKFETVLLEASSPSLLIIAPGVAHGFKSLADESLMVYKTSTEHSPLHDAGILWNSFGYDWDLMEPILSDRDNMHPKLIDFESPF